MAAIIVVQVGQCGNQVGERLFWKLHSHFKQQQQQSYDSSSEKGRSIFFRGSASTARAVLVDTEPKAIDATARAAGPGWRYDPRSQVTTTMFLFTQIFHGGRAAIDLSQLLAKCTNLHHCLLFSRSSFCQLFAEHLLICMPVFWSLSCNLQVCCKGGGGAANNWAYGYCCYGPQCAQAVLAAVSREAEQCDHLGSIVVLHSAAGSLL
jgi:Tubulin/FtsZ family, GTPase domain